MATVKADLDSEDSAIRACISNGLDQIPYETQAVRDWGVEMFHTVDELIDGRRRCLAMTNDRLQQACLSTWTLQVIIEANRLRNDLARITDEETAEIFRQHFLNCFGVDPDHIPEYYDTD